MVENGSKIGDFKIIPFPKDRIDQTGVRDLTPEEAEPFMKDFFRRREERLARLRRNKIKIVDD